MKQNHKTEAKRHEGTGRPQQTAPERLRKAIQFLDEPTGAITPPRTPIKPTGVSGRHHRSQCLTIAKAPLRAAAPITAARSITVISRQLMAVDSTRQ
jgi:hypothetical protein